MFSNCMFSFALKTNDVTDTWIKDCFSFSSVINEGRASTDVIDTGLEIAFSFVDVLCVFDFLNQILERYHYSQSWKSILEVISSCVFHFSLTNWIHLSVPSLDECRFMLFILICEKILNKYVIVVTQSECKPCFSLHTQVHITANLFWKSSDKNWHL